MVCGEYHSVGQAPPYSLGETSYGYAARVVVGPPAGLFRLTALCWNFTILYRKMSAVKVLETASALIPNLAPRRNSECPCITVCVPQPGS